VGTWNAWHAVASDITSTLPYMVSIGAFTTTPELQ